MNLIYNLKSLSKSNLMLYIYNDVAYMRKNESKIMVFLVQQLRWEIFENMKINKKNKMRKRNRTWKSKLIPLDYMI